MRMRIVYTTVLKDCAGVIEEKDGVLYVLLKEDFRHDKIKTDLILSELIRKFRLEHD